MCKFTHGFEYVVKVTTTSTNSAASLVDVSAAEGAATDPRLSLVAASWSVASQTDILWDATSNANSKSEPHRERLTQAELLQGVDLQGLQAARFGSLPWTERNRLRETGRGAAS